MKNKRFFAAALFAVAAIPLNVVADDEVSLDDFEGHWVSTDDALGGPAISTLAWTPALDGKFYAVKYAIDRKSAGETTPLFSGRAFYRDDGDGAFSAFWADSNGDLLPIRAVTSENAIIAHWGTPAQKKEGRTRYELTAAGTLIITDHVRRGDDWVRFNRSEFKRMSQSKAAAHKERHVTGIGGLFFRGANPGELAAWYEKHFQINPPPQNYDQTPWRQDEGYTVFGAFEQDTEYFGNAAKQWMINFRVRDLDGLVRALRDEGIEVSDPESHQEGRFARLVDPEGNPIELWEPTSGLENASAVSSE